MPNYFDELEGSRLFAEWKRTHDLRVMDQLLLACRPVINQMISTWNTTAFAPRDEIVSDVLIHLHQVLERYYDPGRGRLFSFITRSVQNSLFDVVRRSRDQARHLVLVQDDELAKIAVNGCEHKWNLDAIHHCVRNIKTIVSDPAELDGQRWLAKNLWAQAFQFQRFECARALEICHAISIERSRMLVDLTLLGCRRAVLAEYGFTPTVPSRPIGTRGRALSAYREGLSAEEFARLSALMRNLAPYLIFVKARFSPVEVVRGSSRERPLFAT